MKKSGDSYGKTKNISYNPGGRRTQRAEIRHTEKVDITDCALQMPDYY